MTTTDKGAKAPSALDDELADAERAKELLSYPMYCLVYGLSDSEPPKIQGKVRIAKVYRAGKSKVAV